MKSIRKINENEGCNKKIEEKSKTEIMKVG